MGGRHSRCGSTSVLGHILRHSHFVTVTEFCKLLILWCAQKDSNLRPTDS
jgi:hypothetical protein